MPKGVYVRTEAVWNKGLTKETDERLKKLSEHVSGENHYYFGKKRPDQIERMTGENNPMFGVHRYGEEAPMYGKYHTKETKKKISEANFKGDAAGKGAGHARAEALYPVLGICEICVVKQATKRHHKNMNTLDNRRENVAFLDDSCHRKEHVNINKSYTCSML